MAPLHGAIALIKMQHVAVPVAEDLDLDVLGAADVALQEDRVVAEGRSRFLAGLLRVSGEFLRRDPPRACRARRRRKRP